MNTTTCRICGPECQNETTVSEDLAPTSTERPQIEPRIEESITGSPEAFAGHTPAQRADYARHRLSEALAAYLLRYGLADEMAARLEFAERCEGMAQRLKGEREAEKRARRGR
jgi:hypothetical protein